MSRGSKVEDGARPDPPPHSWWRGAACWPAAARVHRYAASASLVSLIAVGCSVPLPPAPAPRELVLPAGREAIIASAADLLEGMGWVVTTVDRPAGQLRAEHMARGDGNGDWMICQNGVGRRGDRRRATTDLTSTVAAQVRVEKAGNGSLVQIRATVPVAYSPFTTTERGWIEYAVPKCVSSGSIEARLADSLAARIR